MEFCYYNTKIIYFYSIGVKEENRDSGEVSPTYIGRKMHKHSNVLLFFPFGIGDEE